MREHPFFSSVTRISDLEQVEFQVSPLPRAHWEMGDYVVGEVLSTHNALSRVELRTGRLPDILQGDLVVGAFGVRAATLEATGDWSLIGDDGIFQQLTPAGLFGLLTSVSSYLPSLPTMRYRGHVHVAGRKARMQDYVLALPEATLDTPVVLVIGTSMSAGKTTAARILIRLLRESSRLVLGTKLTGAGRYRDVLSMQDAGANWILDFVDVGLPSTVCSEKIYRPALRQLLARAARLGPDVVVAEAGASPFEPYNGAVVLEELGEQVHFTVLCASDPYAVLGVMKGFGLRPDLVTGVAASTDAGVALVDKLTGVEAVNVLDHASHPRVRQMLEAALGYSTVG